MRDIAIKDICRKLEEEYGIVLANKIALDFFARDGSWQTMHYANKVKKVHAWEIESKYEKSLIKNLPDNSEINIGDSFSLSEGVEDFFDMVVIDNPQGCFGKTGKYCEHFEAIEVVSRVLKKNGGLIIFNVKTEPFNYETNHQWQKRRNDFYSLEDCSFLSNDFILDFYRNYFSKKGYDVTLSFMTHRPQETGLWAMTMGVEK